jgi:hypothetical protein
VLQNKTNCAEKRIVQLNREVETMEKIVEAKKSHLTEQENRNGNIVKEIARLQEERGMGLYEDPCGWQRKEKSPGQKQPSTQVDQMNSKQTRIDPCKNTGEKTAPQSKGEETKPKRNLRRKQALLIGTSNVKYVNSRFVAESQAYVYKVQKKPEADFEPHVVIYHLLCNNAEKYDKDALTKHMKNLVTCTKSKYPNSKILISLGVPRKDQDLNLKVNTLNITLQNVLK